MQLCVKCELDLCSSVLNRISYRKQGVSCYIRQYFTHIQQNRERKRDLEFLYNRKEMTSIVCQYNNNPIQIRVQFFEIQILLLLGLCVIL